MPPTFPDAERVELETPPLELVVCQIRFPTVLALAANHPPEEFQRRLRGTYPVSRRQQLATVEVGAQAFPGLSSSLVWLFEDRESQWTVSLGAEFLSLETRRYRRFDEFIERFLAAFGEVRQLYPIELRERLGLRHVDRISRARQPFLPEDWSRAVRQEVLVFRQFHQADEPQMSNIEGRFTFGDQMLTVRCVYLDRGFAGASTEELVLDFDCYTERRAGLDGLEDILRNFRRLSYNAFRWALGDVINFFARTQPGDST